MKSWRKHAREGTLPPALLLYVDVVGKWLVLDGPDRREGTWFAAEAQLRSRKGGPEGINRTNRTLLREYAGSSVLP